jgi:hypothetical protein
MIEANITHHETVTLDGETWTGPAAVRGGAVAHRPATGAAGTGVRPVRGGWRGKRRERCASMDGRRSVPAPLSWQSIGSTTFGGTRAPGECRVSPHLSRTTRVAP